MTKWERPKVTDAPSLTQNERDRKRQYRNQLVLAMNALPSAEVLDIVAATLASRADYDAGAVKKFSAEMSDWAWQYVTVTS